jgi:hypothetical protein
MPLAANLIALILTITCVLRFAYHLHRGAYAAAVVYGAFLIAMVIVFVLSTMKDMRKRRRDRVD